MENNVLSDRKLVATNFSLKLLLFRSNYVRKFVTLRIPSLVILVVALATDNNYYNTVVIYSSNIINS